MPKFSITINNYRGFTSRYYEGTYPHFGNKDQAGAMQNISLLEPGVMKQGPGMAELTNGDQGGVVTTLMRGIMRYAVTSGVAYAIGGAKLYKFSSSTVNSGGSPSWPRTILDDGSEVGEDVAHYQGALYYSYNQTGSIGTIGRYDLASTFDDDYWDTGTPAAADLQSAPHQMINGGDDVLYIANGQYIATLDGTVGTPQGLDFWQDAIVNSLTWNYNRVMAAVNRPNITGSNFNQSAIYTWNGFSSSWEGDPIEISGRIGALYTKNGITYVWYEQFEGGSSRLVFGYTNGLRVVPLKTFSGSLPLYYQVGEMGDYIVWLSSGRLYAFGPLSDELNTDMFQIMSPQYTNTAGGIASPFGVMMIASNDGGSNYSLEKESGLETDASYKSIIYQTAVGYRESLVRKITFYFEQLATGAEVDITLRDNKNTSLFTGTISFTGDGAVTRKEFYPQARCENFRIEFSYSDGSASNNIKMKQVVVEGDNYI